MNSAVRNITADHEVSSSDFRGAMRGLTGGVSVITVGRGSDITGMTVTSVSSLSVVMAAVEAPGLFRGQHSRRRPA
jgi:flavin reductase (DIM6/NTAB) family NADH-FMN oxidoreductase RutF